MPSSISLLALAAAATAATATSTAKHLDSFSKGRSQQHETLLSTPLRETKWLVFPQQQDLHAQTVSLETLTPLVANHEKISPQSFFEEHAATLGTSKSASFTKTKEFATNGGSITHQKYKQSISGIPVFGGDFHLTVGSHEGGE
jgi:Zn-dependent metalloprotease